MTEILDRDVYQEGEDIIAGEYKNAKEAIESITKELFEYKDAKESTKSTAK